MRGTTPRWAADLDEPGFIGVDVVAADQVDGHATRRSLNAGATQRTESASESGCTPEAAKRRSRARLRDR